MKNPHGVEPTRFMKRKESKVAIYCDPDSFPIFNNEKKIDIFFHCYEYYCSSTIFNNCTQAYDCDPKYKSLLFTNSTKNYLPTLEVFTIDYQVKEIIYSLCKHPNFIWKYVQTKVLTKEMVQLVDDDTELLQDFSLIHVTDHSVLLKLSQLCLKTPSKYLPNTQLVERKYDSKLREWLGDYKWKLIYRASEHQYTAKSFHEYCDVKGPTLIVVKSTEGWIFGGYTTQSWHPIMSKIEDDDIGTYVTFTMIIH